MGVRDMFEQYIREGKLSKERLLDMLEQIKLRNIEDVVVITDEEYNAIKTRLEQLSS